MIPGLGKQRILVGSAPHCDICLGGPGVLPEHAAIVHQGGGVLSFVDGGLGPSFVNGSPMPPGASSPFDLRSEFVVGQAAVPNAHPAIALMLMEVGQAPPKPGEIAFGRDPARAHIVVHQPQVSGLHAVFNLNPLSVTDQGSTSGTWL